MIIGIYAGSFKPFHVGHANIVWQARNVFEHVVIAIGQNPEKEGIDDYPFPKGYKQPWGLTVAKYEGLLSDYLKTLKKTNSTHDIVLVRGLRNGNDLQYEQNQLEFIKGMYPDLKTVFFICDKKFEHISSSALRALKKLAPDEYNKYTYNTLANNEN